MAKTRAPSHHVGSARVAESGLCSLAGWLSWHSPPGFPPRRSAAGGGPAGSGRDGSARRKWQTEDAPGADLPPARPAPPRPTAPGCFNPAEVWHGLSFGLGGRDPALTAPELMFVLRCCAPKGPRSGPLHAKGATLSGPDSRLLQWWSQALPRSAKGPGSVPIRRGVLAVGRDSANIKCCGYKRVFRRRCRWRCQSWPKADTDGDFGLGAVGFEPNIPTKPAAAPRKRSWSIAMVAAWPEWAIDGVVLVWRVGEEIPYFLVQGGARPPRPSSRQSVRIPGSPWSRPSISRLRQSA